MAQLNSSQNVVVGVYATPPSDHKPETGLFLVFAYDRYYPQGGFNDYLGMALSLSQARKMIDEADTVMGSYQIVSHKTFEVVESGDIDINEVH